MSRYKLNFRSKPGSSSSAGTAKETQPKNGIAPTSKDRSVSVISKKVWTFLSRKTGRVRHASGSDDRLGAATSTTSTFLYPVTPQSSRFLHRPSRSEGFQQGRKYAFDLSNLPHSRHPTRANRIDFSQLPDPESPSEVLRIKRNFGLIACAEDSFNPEICQTPAPESHSDAPDVDPCLEDIALSEMDTKTNLSVYLTSNPSSPSQSQDLQPAISYNKFPSTTSVVPHDDDNNFLHLATILQDAARRERAKENLSQEAIFRFLAPMTLFIFILALGVTVSRKYSHLENLLGTGSMKANLLIAIFGGIAFSLLFLRAIIWVAAILGQSFCEMDLSQVMKKTELVDSDGRHMGETEMFVGHLFG